MTAPTVASAPAPSTTRAPALQVRTARADELAAVGALTRRAFDAGPYGATTDPARVRLMLDAESRARAGDLLVATLDGRPVGTASLLRPGHGLTRQARADEAEIRLLAVDPGVQGHGVGAALVVAAVDRARAWGVHAVVLDTGARNVGAQRLYERLGFERTPTREDTEVPGVGRLVVLVLDLVRPGVLVRRIAPHEHDAVSRLSVEAYAHDHELTDSYRASVGDVATRAREHEVWVAQDRVTGDLLGTVATPRPGAHVSPLGRDGELDFRLLAVAPRARRRGVGALLTRFVVELARERGLRRVVMSSGPTMTDVHRLYERLGFTRLPERETRVVDGATLLAFGLDLDGAAAPWEAPTSHDDPGLP